VVDPAQLALLAAAGALVFALLAEWLHSRRVRRVARLAFGPAERPAPWARAAPALRVLAASALAWGLTTLLAVEPRRWSAEGAPADEEQDWAHVLLVLDVSPSMRLSDAGPSGEESRMQRARALMESFFDRVPLDRYRVSVVAFYNGAKPVVVDTKDFEVVRNILGDLPMHHAFQSGKTKLFDGLEEAAKIAKPWNPRSTTVVVLTDGDTVPAQGMPRMPASVRSVLVVGVGDPRVGKFIDGRQSRQDVSTLRQVAARLSGTYHDGNEKQLPSALIAESTGLDVEEGLERLTRREYALIACVAGSGLLAFLPLLLHALGTRWRPGTRPAPAQGEGSEAPKKAARAGKEPARPATVG
jgi:Ca-activated chloride channel family protein